MIGIAILTLICSIMLIAIVYTFAGFPLFTAFYNLVEQHPYFYNEKLINFYDLIVSVAVTVGIISIIGLFIWAVAYIVRRERYDWWRW